MSLYEKYRPRTLEGIKGNEALKERLSNYFKNESHNHAILLAGPAGTGKSTVAYIIATELIGADKGAIQEIDAASQKEKKDVDRYTEQACKFPNFGEYNVFIFNECQELTPSAKSALLDSTEHVPQQTYYIFTTTDPDRFFKGEKGEKGRKNALSTRFMRFDLTPLDERDSSILVDEVLDSERMALPQAVKDAIVENSNGSGRELVNNVEYCLSCTDEASMLKHLKAEAVNDPQLVELCKKMACNTATWGFVSSVLSDAKENGTDPESIRRMVASWMSSCLLRRYDKRIHHILKVFCNPTYDTGFPQLVALFGEVANG